MLIIILMQLSEMHGVRSVKKPENDDVPMSSLLTLNTFNTINTFFKHIQHILVILFEIVPRSFKQI